MHNNFVDGSPVLVILSISVNLVGEVKHPPNPQCHNNPAELGARARVRKRDVSFGTRSEAGTKAWDTFMTVVATAKKLGVSFYKYLQDRISGAYQMPSLAELITEKAGTLALGKSWQPPP